VIAREEQPGMRGFSLKVGANVDMLRSCSGQVILAFSTPQRTQALSAAALEEGSAADDALPEKLAAIRTRGYDSRRSPITHGVTDISVPVFGFDGMVAAALTIPFLELIDGSQKIDLEAARTLLIRAAVRVSDGLGHNTGAVA
jgi:DNA-binding IclR family transcriptional regulator